MKTESSRKPTVVVAMSGGVDSSTSAALLKQQGYNVIGVTMQIWPDSGVNEAENGCCSLSAVEDARKVADVLDIPYYVVNMKNEFEEAVICDFHSEYSRGRTPNPCIVCNKVIKFDRLLDKAFQLGAEYLATGHYARVERIAENRFLLRKGIDQSKDQSYALYQLTQEKLAHILFPNGDLTKERIRKIAHEMKLPVAKKKDSQEICFIPDNNYHRFLLEYDPDLQKEGDIVDTKGNVVGKHNGIAFYTIGQRKGLGIRSKYPVYVVGLAPEKNQVIVGNAEDTFAAGLVASGCNWISVDKPEVGMKLSVKVRYNFNPVSATISSITRDNVEIRFTEPVRAVTPGQAAVLYDGDVVVGGGVIERSLTKPSNAAN